MLAPNRPWNLWEIMKAFDAGHLFIAITGLSNSAHFPLRPGETVQIPTMNMKQIREKIDFICEHFRILDLPMSLDSAEALKKALGESVPGHSPHCGETADFTYLAYATYQNFAKELVSRFKSEMSTKTVFSISSRHSNLLKGSALFGEAVDEAFPDINYDIEEAGKCLAFGRSTACVFHLMRAAEGAASVLSDALGGKTHNEQKEPLTFGGLFMQISNIVELMPRGADKDSWVRLKGFMSGLNRGFRTKVAHAGTTYTEAQAESLFGLTKSFMEEAVELLERACLTILFESSSASVGSSSPASMSL